jgi:hypothetical protein
MPEPDINQGFANALHAASRLHNLFLSTATMTFLSATDAALVIQQAREEMHPISSFCDDAEEILERDGEVPWALKK